MVCGDDCECRLIAHRNLQVVSVFNDQLIQRNPGVFLIRVQYEFGLYCFSYNVQLHVNET